VLPEDQLPEAMREFAQRNADYFAHT
jgi:hypothetical protein